MKFKDYEEMLEVPEGITVKLDVSTLTVSGPKGEITRNFFDPRIKMDIKENNLVFQLKVMTKKEKMQLGTIKSHIKNMYQGVNNAFVYKLKICSGHFPMNVSIANNEIVIKNFLGEKTPRITKVLEGSSVKLEGEFITVESPSKETAGQMGANIERLTKIKGKDLRVFQDGIYLINKDGKEIK